MIAHNKYGDDRTAQLLLSSNDQKVKQNDRKLSHQTQIKNIVQFIADQCELTHDLQ